MASPKTIAILALPGVQLTDVSGPLDVFAEVNRQVGKKIYRIEVVGVKLGSIRSSSGVRIMADRSIGSNVTGRLHTFLIAGGPDFPRHKPSSDLLEFLDREIKRSHRYGSVCSGAFLLAATGRLHKRRITTHWSVADLLAERYPTVKIDKDALFVKDGAVRTAAGVTAGMDLALALITEDVGREIAMRVASRLVMFFKRPGGQMQFSRNGAVAPACRTTFQELQRWVRANPAADLSVPHLAERVGLSSRHFARLFRAETGISPAAWIEAARVEAARTLFEETGASPKEVAVDCGFSDVNVLRHAFKRQLGITPAEYYRRCR